MSGQRVCHFQKTIAPAVRSRLHCFKVSTAARWSVANELLVAWFFSLKLTPGVAEKVGSIHASIDLCDSPCWPRPDGTWVWCSQFEAVAHSGFGEQVCGGSWVGFEFAA